MIDKGMKRSTLENYQVCLKAVEEKDLSMVRAWRNDPSIAQFMLSQETISEEQQLAWFRKVSRDTTQQHYIIHYRDKPIGAANIKTYYPGETLFGARALEPGLYIADERYRNNILAFSPTLVLNDYCFDELKAGQLKAVVKGDNQAALNYNAKLGYQVDKQGELVEISLTKENYFAHSKGLKALLSRQSIRR